MTTEKGFCVHEGRQDAYEACECWGRQERTESGGQVTAGVEATLPGRLVRILTHEDSSIEVGTLLAIIASPGEDPA